MHKTLQAHMPIINHKSQQVDIGPGRGEGTARGIEWNNNH